MSIISFIKKAVSIFPLEAQRNIYLYKNKIARSGILKSWGNQGSPVPPPHQYKQFIVEQVGKKYGLKTLVETGTCLGHMIEAQRNNFFKLYSIEVEPTLYKNANKYFSPYLHIEIIEGDSAIKLGQILKRISNESVLFWLDGHYSGGITGMGDKECPIYEELQAIFDQRVKTKYILIDDARCFDGTNDYPTLDELNQFVKSKDKDLKMEILHDIIHLH